MRTHFRAFEDAKSLFSLKCEMVIYAYMQKEARIYNITHLVTRGLYSPLFQEKPPKKKLLFLADFIKNWAPFIKNNLYRPESQKVRKCSLQAYTKPKKLVLQLCYCATFVETALMAQKNIEFPFFL